jgi:hypothetical protein
MSAEPKRRSNWQQRVEILAPHKWKPLSDEETVMVPAFRCPRSLKERLEAAPGGSMSEKLRAAVELYLQSVDSESGD